MLGLKKIQTSLSEEKYLLLWTQNRENCVTNELLFCKVFIAPIVPFFLLILLILPSHFTCFLPFFAFCAYCIYFIMHITHFFLQTFSYLLSQQNLICAKHAIFVSQLVG